MIYVRHAPSPPLDRYISYLYYLEGQMPFLRERILPLSMVDLKINLGDAFSIYDDATGCPKSLTESWLVGLYNRHHTIDWPTQLSVYAVRFKPGGAYPFLGLPVSEFYNQVVDLSTIWGRFASEARERLYNAPTTAAGLALFERLMRDHLGEPPPEQKLVEYSFAEIERNHGAVSIRALSERVSISQNHLLSQFKRVVGTSAKEAARLNRFEHVLRSIDPARSIDWTWIAHQYGYYDQSHLNKDFAKFTGHNPTAYLNLRRRVNQADALVDRLSLRSLPAD